MVSEMQVRDALRTILDPEMPISIVDLGMIEKVEVHEEGAQTDVMIDVLPTFIGCPALPVIEKEIHQRVGRIPGVGEVKVRFLFDPPWSIDRISREGRSSLQAIGVSVPDCRKDMVTAAPESVVRCPFCGAAETHMTSSFGPTRCRMIFYCESCRNSFERMKRV